MLNYNYPRPFKFNGHVSEINQMRITLGLLDDGGILNKNFQVFGGFVYNTVNKKSEY